MADKSDLQKVAFVPVANGTRLVTANSLFVRLTVNLSPFAFELPTLYLPYVKILKDIGLQDVLSVTYAKDLLLNIQRLCGYQHLNPNELRAVMEVLHFICDGAVKSRADGPELLPEAIVPDDGCRLVLARSCVYVDAYGSQLLRNIDTSGLRFVHPDLPEKICMTLGIKKLSDMVVEVNVTAGIHVPLLNKHQQCDDIYLSKNVATCLIMLVYSHVTHDSIIILYIYSNHPNHCSCYRFRIDLHDGISSIYYIVVYEALWIKEEETKDKIYIFG